MNSLTNKRENPICGYDLKEVSDLSTIPWVSFVLTWMAPYSECKLFSLGHIPKKDKGNVERHIIELTMSNRVLFLLSVTPFCCGVP